MPFALLVVAAASRDLRPFVLVALVAGTGLSIATGSALRWAWAAPLPVSLSLATELLPAPVADPGGGDCTDPLSPPAAWRLAEAVLVLAAVVVLAIVLRESRAGLWLRSPSRRVVVIATVALFVLASVGLFLGAALATPFFGPVSLDLSRPQALLPALLFAGSNAVMEEVAYRGCLTAWASRALPIGWAVGLQAVVFGIAHGGPGFVASPIPVMVAMAAGATLAALIAIRTGSLLLPIAAHTALDLPIYFYFACGTA